MMKYFRVIIAVVLLFSLGLNVLHFLDSYSSSKKVAHGELVANLSPAKQMLEDCLADQGNNQGCPELTSLLTSLSSDGDRLYTLVGQNHLVAMHFDLALFIQLDFRSESKRWECSGWPKITLPLSCTSLQK